MISRSKELGREALAAALRLRTATGRSLVEPICIYDLAEELKIELRFADIPSLEGMYSSIPRPAILIGSERPPGRRVYTCAHEIGHHQFGHGTRIDELRCDDGGSLSSGPEEFLAQVFAGFLLMPKLAICSAFIARGWKPAQATEEQIYRISNYFGVTYTGLVQHMTVSLSILSEANAARLLNAKLKDIRGQFISDPKRQLVLVDRCWEGRPIDLEVGDLVLAPERIECEGRCLIPVNLTSAGELFEASRPGRDRFSDSSSGWASYVRVSRRNYVGRSIYRHLPEAQDE
jgi:Zn-dependent peptidase ImmA (M78 family)